MTFKLWKLLLTKWLENPDALLPGHLPRPQASCDIYSRNTHSPEQWYTDPGPAENERKATGLVIFYESECGISKKESLRSLARLNIIRLLMPPQPLRTDTVHLGSGWMGFYLKNVDICRSCHHHYHSCRIWGRNVLAERCSLLIPSPAITSKKHPELARGTQGSDQPHQS